MPAYCYLAALAAPVVLAGAASALVGPPSLELFGVAPGFPVMGVLALWLCQVLYAGIGEEAGWRGFALPLLRRRFSRLGAAAIVSMVWAAWHLPLLGVLGSFEVMAEPAMLPVFWFGLLCLSVVLAWLYELSGGSVLVVAVWHGTYNVVAGTAAAQGGLNVAFTVGLMVWAAVVTGWSVLRSRRSGVTPRRGSAGGRG